MAGRPGRSTPPAAAPARKGKAASGRPARSPTVLGRVFARPGMIVAGASFAAVMTGIVANALLLQKGHHPSPLFSPAPSEFTEPSRPAVPLPPPAPRPAAVPEPVAPAQGQVQAEAPAAAPAQATPPAPVAAAHSTKKAAHPAAPHTAATAHKAAAAPHQDLIGQLLNKH